MTVPLLIIQPGADDPPGLLGDWLTAAGAEITVNRPYAQDVPETLDGYRGLVVLGGAMGALDDIEYPWLARVRGLLATATRDRVPTLAVCLGAQLLAAAVGGRVRVIPDGPEVGAGLVAKRDAAAEDPLWADVPLSPDVVQFHTDEVATLPPSATLLASSPRCANQAYRVGSTGYAVQFHVETTPEVVLGWADAQPDAAATVPAARLEPGHLAEVHENMAEVWQPFAERFVRLAAGQLSSRPPLPLA